MITDGINFRAYTETDAEDIIKLLKETYANSYIRQKLYDINTINEYNRSGLIRFTVTEIKNGRIIGVIGRERSEYFENQCEIVTQIIEKEYRGMNISKPQLSFEVNEIINENANYTSLYSHILAYHNKAQRNLENLGFISCGFVLNIYDASVFTVNGNAPKIKYSQTIAVKPHKQTDAGTLFLPSSLEGIFKNTYDKLGVLYNIKNTSSNACGTSVIKFRKDDDHKHIEVYVYRIGADFRERIRHLCQADKDGDSWVINLYLNAKDTSAVKVYEFLEKNDFFFTGIQPLSNSGEFVVMHNPLKHVFSMNDVVHIESQNPFAEIIRVSIGEAD